MNKLRPERLLVPTWQDVSDILARYDLPLLRFEAATSGIENLTLIVWSKRRRYVLRVYPQGLRSDASILLEFDFMSHLRAHGLPVPGIVAAADQQRLVIHRVEDTRWQCILMEHAAGKHPKAYTPALLDDMATLQGTMHILGESYARALNMPGARSVLHWSDGIDEPAERNTHSRDVRDFLARAGLFTVELPDSLPGGVSHLDYDMDNILAKNDRVTAILDFGDIECLPVVVCLGYTLWDVLFEPGGSPERLVRYLQRYQAVRPLNQHERGLLPRLTLFRHYVITLVQLQLGEFGEDDLAQALRREEFLRSAAFRF